MKKPSSITIEGAQFVPELKRAITEASILQSICKITHNKEEAAIISVMWIPLIMRLTGGTFTKNEIDILKEKLNSAKTAKEASHVLASWAEELK